MKRDYRVDMGGKITTKMDDNGYLRIDGIAAHVGILEYMEADGSIVRELVTEETLFNTDSIASLIGSPVTLDHPPELVSPANYSKYSVGSVNNARRDGDNLVVSLSVIGKDALTAIESGIEELSPGYSVDLDETPGEWNGQKYDRAQLNRRYNHQSIVDSARGGRICSLRFDGATVPNNEGNQMTQVKLPGGGTVEVADAAAAATISAALTKQGKRLDSTKTQLSKLVKSLSPKLKFDADDVLKEKENTDEEEVVSVDVDAVVAAVDQVVETLQAQVDELTEATATSDPELTNMDDDEDKKDPSIKTDSLSKMLGIIENAKKLKPSITHLDGKRVKTAREIQVEALIAAKQGFNADGKSDAYIAARFDAATEGLQTRTDSLRTQRQGFNLDSVMNTREQSGQAAFNDKFYKGKA